MFLRTLQSRRKIGRTETNLKQSGKHAPRSKSVSGTTVPEIILANQDGKISGNPSSPTFNIESKLAIDNTNSFNNSNSNIMNSIRPSVDDLGVGTGNTNRNRRPRYHMDKLSEYILKYLLNTTQSSKMQRVIFNSVFEFPLFIRMHLIHLFFVCFFYFAL